MRPSPSRLTIVHTDFHRGWGGQINQVMTSCRGLRQRGHRVLLAVPAAGLPAQKAQAEQLELFGAVRFRGAGQVLSLLKDALALQRLIRRERVDILHSHGSQDTWAGVLANRLLPSATRIPHVYTRHNTKRVRDHALNRRLFGRWIDQLVVVAPEVLDRFEPFLAAGLLDRAQIPVLPSPLRPDVLSAVPNREQLRAELRIDRPAVLIGTMARLVPDKGQRYLLEAADRLIAQGLDLHVALGGNGSDEAMLRALVEASPRLRSRVHFLGFRSDVADVTAGLDVAVLPSIDCDASSGVIKEALALGVPVVATEIGAARELLGDGSFGAIVRPADSVALAGAIATTLAELPAAQARAAQGGAAIRARYTVEHLIDGLDKLYHQLVARRAL
jgi:glycosyltransferase involved in cell wall biosynthesis